MQKSIDQEIASVMQSVVKLDNKMRQQSQDSKGMLKALSEKQARMAQRAQEVEDENEREREKMLERLKNLIPQPTVVQVN